MKQLQEKKNGFYNKTHTKEVRIIIAQKNKIYQKRIYDEKFIKYKDNIIILYYKNKSIKNIGIELKISYRLVRKILKDLNLPIGIKARNLIKKRNNEK